MEFEKVLENRGIRYRKQKFSKGIPIYTINDNINVVILTRNDGVFDIERKLFDYLTKQTINYSFLLINKKEKKVYYLEFKNRNNWLSSSFNDCTKEKLYFGKIVLNHQSSFEDFLKKLASY